MIKSEQSVIQTLPFAGVKHIHMVGVGGVGMSGIAQVLHNLGYYVSGSDLTDNIITKKLNDLGIQVYIGHAASNITSADVVVKSTAIKQQNPEIDAALSRRVPVISRAEMLAELMRFKCGIAISGTHGKTTTTSMIAHIFSIANLDPTYVIGGQISHNSQGAALGKGEFLIAEADESDASFLYLNPMLTVVTNIDADHLQTYQNSMHNLQAAFLQFVHKVPFYGLVVLCIDDANVRKLLPNVARPVVTYGFNADADVRCEWMQDQPNLNKFKVRLKKTNSIIEISMPVSGRHNILNALAAICVAKHCGISEEKIIQAFTKFSGVNRRLQTVGIYKIADIQFSLMDDYGHHPNEISVVVETLRSIWPKRRIIMVFQAHRYTRLAALFKEFVQVLSQVDILYLAPVYACQEEVVSGYDLQDLQNSITELINKQPILLPNLGEDVYAMIEEKLADGDIVLAQGAGSIGKFCQQLKSHWQINTIQYAG